MGYNKLSRYREFSDMPFAVKVYDYMTFIALSGEVFYNVVMSCSDQDYAVIVRRIQNIAAKRGTSVDRNEVPDRDDILEYAMITHGIDKISKLLAILRDSSLVKGIKYINEYDIQDVLLRKYPDIKIAPDDDTVLSWGNFGA